MICILDLTNLCILNDSANLRNIRKDIQMVFQDPYTSLNPRISIGAALAVRSTVLIAMRLLVLLMYLSRVKS